MLQGSSSLHTFFLIGRGVIAFDCSRQHPLLYLCQYYAVPNQSAGMVKSHGPLRVDTPGSMAGARPGDALPVALLCTIVQLCLSSWLCGHGHVYAVLTTCTEPRHIRESRMQSSTMTGRLGRLSDFANRGAKSCVATCAHCEGRLFCLKTEASVWSRKGHRRLFWNQRQCHLQCEGSGWPVRSRRANLSNETSLDLSRERRKPPNYASR